MRKTAPPKLLEEQVSTGTVAVSADPNAPPRMTPTDTGTLRADPRSEYVSGGTYSYTASYLRSLPFTVDDLTQDFGDDLYERMMFDAQVSSCIHTLKMGVLAQGVQLIPAKKPDDPDGEQAEEIAAFCRRTLDNLRTPLLPALYDMLDALALGNRVAEQVYDLEDTGEDRGRLVLRALKVKPRRSVAFVVDAYTNVVGLLGLVPGQGSPLLVSSLVGDPGHQPNLLPRAKFAVLTFRPKNADPRGQSILRPAYNAWNLKMQVWGDYLRYLSQFASPSLIGVTAPDAQPQYQRDATGNVITDPATGLPQLFDPGPQLLASLQAFQNGTAIVVPNGAEVNPLQVQGDGGPFLSAIELFDQQISKAILCQTLATGEAQHQARAASQTHQDILGMVVQSAKFALATMLEWDVLAKLVEYNFGPESVALAPKVSLSDTAAEDFAGNATAVASLFTAGYFAPSQMADVDAKLSLPIRTAEDLEAQKRDAADAMAAEVEAKRAALAPPAPTDNPNGDSPKGKANADG